MNYINLIKRALEQLIEEISEGTKRRIILKIFAKSLENETFPGVVLVEDLIGLFANLEEPRQALSNHIVNLNNGRLIEVPIIDGKRLKITPIQGYRIEIVER